MYKQYNIRTCKSAIINTLDQPIKSGWIDNAKADGYEVYNNIDDMMHYFSDKMDNIIDIREFRKKSNELFQKIY